MSILIKGMDKPTDCGLCPFEDFGYCSVKGERNTSESGIDADCPLIEVADRKTEPTGYNLTPVEDEPHKDCNGCKFVGTYDTEFPCANCSRKTKDYYAKDEPQADEYGHTIQGTGDCDHCSRLFVDCDGR